MEHKLLAIVMKHLSYMKKSLKCRKLFRQLFCDESKSSGHICWYANWEMVVQIHRIGLKTILEQFIKVANQNGWAKKSSTKLFHLFDDNASGLQAKADTIVAAAAISYAGDIFCKSCYILEGNLNSVFRNDAVLSHVETFVGTNEHDFTVSSTNPKMQTGINRAVALMGRVQQEF
eukprot:8411532-Ditylum_brightwellii.AAC.1